MPRSPLKVVILASIVLLGGVFYSKYITIQPSVSRPTPTSKPSPTPAIQTTVSDEEKAKIDAWIKVNNLNKYGDSQGTFYTGGTPLFNESTGETIDLYAYILSKHPDRPWNK